MASLLTGTTIAANIALHAGNVATYALPIGGGTLASTNDQILTLNKSSGTGWGYIGFSQAGTRRFYFGLNGSFEPELGVDNGGTFRVIGGMTVAGNAVLTSTSTLTAGNLSGTMPSGVLGNSTHYVGTTAIALNRASASQTLTGVSIDGNAATVGSVSKVQLFNNTGIGHGTYTTFAALPDFGFYFMQGQNVADAPAAQAANQYYVVSMGLGNEYSYSSYAKQIALPRITVGGGNNYLWIRERESTTWGSWGKVYAGYADTAGNASTVTTNANLTGHITSVGNATSLGSFTSAQLLAALTDETGTGANVFATSPTLVTPILGTPSSGNLANCTFPTLNQNTTGNAATATNVAWTGITGGARTNYLLEFQPPANSYAGFAFKTSAAGEAGYFLVKGTADGDVYTAEGITLVADAGWLTLAQRTTASRGVRIMTGTSSAERLKITTAGDVQIVNGNSFTYNSNVVLHAGNYTSYPDATKLPLSGGSMTGYIIGAVSGLWNTYNSGSFTAYGNATNPALISFHRPNYFATNLGLDTDGVMKIGGWSLGGPWPILHSNNFNTYALPLSGGTLTGGLSGTTGTFSGTLTASGDLTILNLIGSYQNTSVYNSANTLSTTPSRGIRAQSSSIQFTDSYAIAPYYTYRTTGDWPIPYGIGWGTGGESSGIFQRYAANGYSFGDMVFYTGNDSYGAFSFRRHTWEGTTYFAAGSHHLDTELFRIDWAGKATATSFALSGGFTITHPGSGYAEFSNWVLLGTTGFYSSTNSAHLHPNTGTYGSWKITGTRGGYGGIEFESGVSLMVNSNQVGFHRNGYGWQLWWSAGTAYCHKGDPGGGTQATILDSSNVASYALPIGGGTLTGALSGTTASFSGAITQGGNQVLHAGNFATYALPLNPDGDGVCVAYSDENPTFNGVSVGGGWYFGADGSTTGGGLTAKILNAFGGGVNSTNGYYVGNNNFLANSSTTTTTLCIDGSNNHFANELTISGQGMGAYNLMKYSGIRSGDWQTFTNTEGQLNVIQVNNITSGAHTNYPTGVYGYGAVMSWRTNSHSFQLYAAHTGDLAYKTQWGNDNYSGWRRILDSTNYPYAAAMNQNVGTSNSPTFASLLITSEIVIQKDNARNLVIQGSGGADCGLLGRGSSGQFAFQLYGNNNSEYGFLNSAWGGWDLRKVPSGSLFLNGNVTYYLNPASATNLYSLTVANTISGSITGNAGGSSVSCTGNAASSTVSTYVSSLGNSINYEPYNGSRTAITKTNGLSHYSGYSTGANRPTTYDYTLQVADGSKGWEISMDWISLAGPAIFARSLRDCCQGWSAWVRILDSVNYSYAAAMNQNVGTGNSPSFTGLSVINTITGAVSGNAGTVTNGLYTTGGQTIAGITYFSNGESINAYGIRGRFTNEYLHLYNKVGVGHSGGWGQGETSTPDKGLSTYGGLNIAYGDNGISTFNGVIRANSNIRQGADLARPLSSWSVTGTSTGMVIFSFPGNTSNYGMVHCVFDIYEYNSNTVSTVIVGGHNYGGSWYNTGANVIGRCGKSVRLGVKDSKYCVVFGGAASSWEYGTIILRKIHNGGFYTGIMDMGGSFTTQQTATESFSNISGDLRALRTSADFIADGGISGTTGTFSGELNIAGNYQIRNTIPTITFRDTDHRTGFIHVNSNIFYILTGVADSGYGNWTQVANSRWPLELNLSTNNAVFGADVNAISFTGAGTGLTGTATSLSVGGNAATATGQQSGVHFTLNTGGAGYGLVGVYNPDLHQGLFAMGPGYTLGAGGTLGNLYGVSWSYDYSGRQLNTGYNLGHCLAIANAGSVYTVIGQGIWTSGLIRANGAISSGGTITAAAFSGPLTGNVIGNVTGNLTGLASSATTAGNVNGYSTSTGVGANTIVVRDASGYIYAHYINTNVSESENPSVSSFFTSNGDGWLRKSTVAHVKYTLSLSGTNTGDQTNISGSSGSCTGNAASVTDGVYLSTNQSIGGVKTFSSAPIATNIAKAWVYYNKSTTTINASYNVSSVTSNGTGVFTVNFTNAMVDTNYVVAGTATYGYDDQDIYGMALIVPRRSTAQQAGSCRLATEFLHAAQVYDCVAVRAVFYR